MVLQTIFWGLKLSPLFFVPFEKSSFYDSYRRTNVHTGRSFRVAALFIIPIKIMSFWPTISQLISLLYLVCVGLSFVIFYRHFLKSV